MSDENLSSSSETESEIGDDLSQDHVHHKGHFHGCYLLVSKNSKFKGRTYIGYTVNPNRRIKQHNGGQKKGGARKTSGRGPWDMVLIVHGFPNDIAALRFEWAWQHPDRSRRLGASIAKKVSKETPLQYKLRILSHMLSIGPWYRLPLTIQWLKQEYELQFPSQRQPPVHMPFAYGVIDIQETGHKKGDSTLALLKMDKPGSSLVISTSVMSTKDDFGSLICHLCGQSTLESIQSPVFLHCYHKHCSFFAHAVCLASELCTSEQIIPIGGYCPVCKMELLWGELVRQHQEHIETTKKECNTGSIVTHKSQQLKQTSRFASSKAHWTEGLHIS